MSVGLGILILSTPDERLSLCVIAKTALAVAATLLLTSTPTLETPMTLTTGRNGGRRKPLIFLGKIFTPGFIYERFKISPRISQIQCQWVDV